MNSKIAFSQEPLFLCFSYFWFVKPKLLGLKKQAMDRLRFNYIDEKVYAGFNDEQI